MKKESLQVTMRCSAKMILLLTLWTVSGCSLMPEPGGSAEIDTEYLTQHWVHSREEEPEGSDLQVYRPDDYKDFPSSWFRMQYIFEEGGDCEWLFLAPDDGHYFKAGTWQLENEDVIVVDKGERTSRYRVVELTEDLLQMRPLDGP